MYSENQKTRLFWVTKTSENRITEEEKGESKGKYSEKQKENALPL